MCVHDIFACIYTLETSVNSLILVLLCLQVVSTATLCVCPVQMSSALAVIVMSMYQHALSNMGLANYILHGANGTGSRRGLLDANREGIFSCLGYAALYLTGVQIGSLLFSKK